MIILAPLRIEQVNDDIRIPYVLINNKEIQVTIENFTIKEKEWFFGFKNLKIDKQKIKYDSVDTNSYNLRRFQDVLTPYKLVVENKKKNSDIDLLTWQTQKILDELGLIFEIIIGCEFSIYKYKQISKKITSEPLIWGEYNIHSARQIDKLDPQALGKIKSLTNAYLRDKSLINSTPVIYFDLAMSQVNKDIRGSLFISSLESIFARDSNTEIAYRLSLRMTKLRGEGIEYKNKVCKLYGKRSRVYHGDKTNTFTEEDLKFLEEEVCWALEKYVTEPKNFEAKTLDKLLLDKNT